MCPQKSRFTLCGENSRRIRVNVPEFIGAKRGKYGAGHLLPFMLPLRSDWSASSTMQSHKPAIRWDAEASRLTLESQGNLPMRTHCPVGFVTSEFAAAIVPLRSACPGCYGPLKHPTRASVPPGQCSLRNQRHLGIHEAYH